MYLKKYEGIIYSVQKDILVLIPLLPPGFPLNAAMVLNMILTKILTQT